MLRLNLGCGSVVHPDWVNLDSSPAPGVTVFDLRRPLSFGNSTAEACYASHVLEHLRRDEARRLLCECHRVLRGGGVIRIAVPDLEGIARAYLRTLDDVGPTRVADHQWMVVELIDQLVRTIPGGEMQRLLTAGNALSAAFIVDRVGLDAERLLNGDAPSARSAPGWRHYARRLREEIAIGLASLVLGSEGGEAMREGIFRRSGQVHQWMYDRLSLAQLMTDSGFVSARVCRADESAIAGFAASGFDMVAGRVRKPDSLFMEATKT